MEAPRRPRFPIIFNCQTATRAPSHAWERAQRGSGNVRGDPEGWRRSRIDPGPHAHAAPRLSQVLGRRGGCWDSAETTPPPERAATPTAPSAHAVFAHAPRALPVFRTPARCCRPNFLGLRGDTCFLARSMEEFPPLVFNARWSDVTERVGTGTPGTRHLMDKTL